MKVLITGATGLIGKQLTTLLLQNGVNVHYLTTSKRKIENEPNYKGFYWNPTQGIIDENCILGVDAIIHLAGASISKRWSNTYKQEIVESRLDSSNLLFKALKSNSNQVKQIISASGTAIYPNSNSIIYTENSPEISNTFLGNLVIKWEESIDKFKLLDITVCKFRTGIVLSNKGGALLEMVRPIKLGFGAAFGNGKQMQSWIHIHDLAALYFYAIEHKWEGVFNAVSPSPTSNELITKTIASVLKKPLFMPNIPQFVMKLLLGEMHVLLFENKNISSNKVTDLGFEFKYKSIDQAIENLY
jgi:uncharacterized protein (TIGR01777 family)